LLNKEIDIMNELELRKKALSLPLKPGVYLMKNTQGGIIYVGKAKLLRNRVYSYFHASGSHTVKVAKMVSNVHDFDVILTDTEFEALMLENSLIKHHKPKYNILLKDDKGYPFIRVDDRERYPSFSLAMKMVSDGARYFGPYQGRRVAFEVIDILRETFRLPSCSKKFPRDLYKERPCLNKHLGKCTGICDGTVSASQYRELIDQAILLLEGNSKTLEQSLRKEMTDAAEILDFERAARLRDRLAAIEKLGQRQKVVANKVPDIDVICLYQGTVRSCAAVLHYIDGTLLGKDMELIHAPLEEADLTEAMEEFLKQYYQSRTAIPGQIAVSCEIDEDGVLASWLSSKTDHKVTILTPKRGDKKRLIEMAMENAREEAQRATTTEERIAKVLETIASMLGTEVIPERIEAYDISNTAGGETVGGMVVFKNGKPSKSDYRKFRIKSIAGQDDYGSMTEMLERRLENMHSGDEKFCEKPQLLLIDGGLGHVVTAKQVVDRFAPDIYVFGMVKDDHHRTRALVTPDGDEIGIASNPSVYSFIGTIQEEVHRFAIGYHRTLRGKKMTHSSLDDIPGIGPERRKLLLKHFRTIDSIKKTTYEELAKVLPKNAAKAVYDHYHKENEES